ncbi:D-alanine--D-alanine ligase family protein [Streptomyces griseoaurantiacus]|jgi:D-alanine-D-alanine ligase|uniref:D-alanine--D-alanine ligase family protein n=1 Tax=Streptomyces griseoaurantiacus TaxID=68213 RepID=UPI0034611033
MSQDVILLVGGRSTEHDASLHSYAHLVPALLADRELKVTAVVYIDPEGGRWRHDAVPGDISALCDRSAAQPLTPAALLELLGSGPSVFSLLFGTEGEDGAWQGVGEVFDLPGSFGPVSAAAVSMHKLAFSAAAVALEPRLSRPDSWLIRADDPRHGPANALAALNGRPCVVKPNSMGASLLTTYLAEPDLASLTEAVGEISGYDTFALVQEYIEGEEYTVGVFEDAEGPHILPIARAQTASPLLGHAEKHRNGLVRVEFTDENSTVGKTLADICLRTYRLMGFRLWCRFDLIWDRHRDRPVILEANSMPGLMRGSIYPVMLERAGHSLADLVRAGVGAHGRTGPAKVLRYDIEPHTVPSLHES